MQCFPIGQADGGRDAVRAMRAKKSAPFSVYQVKFLHKPLAEPDPHKWLLGIVKEEAPKLSKLIPKGARGYYLLTNVPGTGHLESGSIDKVNEILSEHLKVPAMCWWRDDVNRRLDITWSLKWVYPELMSGPDILRAIVESGLSEHRERRTSSILAFLRQQYEVDEEVRFKQVELQNKLLELFIDVPLLPRDGEFAKHFREASQTPIQFSDNFDYAEADSAQNYALQFHSAVREDEPVGAAAFLLRRRTASRFPKVVLEGAPGQGKSTVAQYICQVHRMKLLQMSAALASIPPQHRDVPVRLPIRVDLRDFATWLAGRNPFVKESDHAIVGQRRSLEGFLAFLISHQSGGTSFSADDLLAVARISALLLVFDGLDEVADIPTRRNVVSEIAEGVKRLAQNSASLQTIVTSRPAAFANSPGMPEKEYTYLQLVALSPELILRYAELWMAARRLDKKLRTEFRQVLESKLEQPHLRDLARNPMQLAILLSLILTRGSSLPDKRTALYDFYMELFFNRESEKSSVVREHRDLLVELHRYLAWLLHSESEKGKARASISQDRLQTVVADYLRKEGYDPTLADQLFTGMVERVVALVSRVQGTFEFEVQPLREYFAACFLFYTAPHSSPGKEKPGPRPDRFDAIARNFYWLNVTRFYAGCYSKGELPSLVERIQALSAEEGYDRISDPRELAITLLADWVFNQNPRSVHQVVDLLFEPKGFRRLLALNSDIRRGREFRHLPPLPAKCGREELIDRCFVFLEKYHPKGLVSDLLRFLNLNSESPDDLSSKWIHHFRSSSPSRRKTWLEHGLVLKVLPTLALSDVNSLFPSAEHDVDAIQSLCQSGRFDFLEDSESKFDAAVDETLNGSIQLPYRGPSVKSILGSFCYAASPTLYQSAYMHRGPGGLNQAISRYYGLELDPDTLPLSKGTESYVNYPKCKHFVEVVDRERVRQDLDWTTDLQPWNTIVETGRNLWGETKKWQHLAVLSTYVVQRDRTSDSPDLIDKTRPLCQRVLFGSRRADDPNYWANQLSSTSTNEDRRFVCMVMVALADPKVLAQHSGRVGELLDAFRTKDWTWIYDTAEECQLPRRVKGHKVVPLKTSDIPASISARMACVLALRGGDHTAMLVYRKCLQKRLDAEPQVLEFAVRYALDLNHFGTDKWNPNLEVIRQCYALGESNPYMPYRIDSRRREKQKPMPVSIAEKILDSPTDYPSYLVNPAVDRYRIEVARRTVPVADIADRDHWFSH